MVTVPAEILAAVRSDDDAAFDALVSNEDCCFAVDWREADDDIVRYCESLLGTGRLSAEWVAGDLFVIFGSKRVRVPLMQSPADRHITLLTLNEALSPEFEARRYTHRSAAIQLHSSPSAWMAGRHWSKRRPTLYRGGLQF